MHCTLFLKFPYFEFSCFHWVHALWITRFSYKHLFYMLQATSGWNWDKNQANAKQHPEAEHFLFENYSHSLFTVSSKKKYLYSWKFTINLNENEYKSYRYDINRTWSGHGCKFINIKSFSVWYIQSNIWSSIHEKVKQHWGWVEIKRYLQKKRTYSNNINLIYVD